MSSLNRLERTLLETIQKASDGKVQGSRFLKPTLSGKVDSWLVCYEVKYWCSDIFPKEIITFDVVNDAWHKLLGEGYISGTLNAYDGDCYITSLGKEALQPVVYRE